MSIHGLARVDVHAAEAQLPELIRRVESGEEILICRGGRPAAILVPVSGEVDLSKLEEISAEA